MINEASPIKRRRATKAEMEERAEWLIAYARDHAPVTVRGLYYQAEVAGLPGIEKDEKAYNKVQRQVLDLRRAGRMPYGWIADGTRWMRKPRTYDIGRMRSTRLPGSIARASGSWLGRS